jgi:predicted dehydrogenase
VANRPLCCALIGIGTRAKKLYLPLARAVAPWLEFAAVVSPDAANATEAGATLGVPHFASLAALLKAEIAEAAIVLSSIESHHAISVTLSRHGIHHLVETPMATTFAQAQQMVETARAAGVTLLVAENYFRCPFDRLARQIAVSGAIGDVGRVSCFHDQVGWHGHARWMKFFDAWPEAVQSLAHAMPTARHRESANRIHESEAFRACHLLFPGGRVAVDMGGNLKGLIGRTERPGYTEIDGSRGAIVRLATGGLDARADLRVVSDAALERNGKADHVAPFVDRIEDGVWIGSEVSLPGGRVTWDNAYRPQPVKGPKLKAWDGPVVLEIMAEFADEASGIRPSAFSAEDALKATEVEMASRESALHGGVRLALPVGPGDLESEAIVQRAIRGRFGCDPLDAEAMSAVHFPPAF